MEVSPDTRKATGDSADGWAANGVPNSMMLAKPFALAQLVTAVSQLITSASSTTSLSTN